MLAHCFNLLQIFLNPLFQSFEVRLAYCFHVLPFLQICGPGFCSAFWSIASFCINYFQWLIWMVIYEFLASKANSLCSSIVLSIVFILAYIASILKCRVRFKRLASDNFKMFTLTTCSFLIFKNISLSSFCNRHKLHCFILEFSSNFFNLHSGLMLEFALVLSFPFSLDY